MLLFYIFPIIIYTAILCSTLLQLIHHHFLPPLVYAAGCESNSTKNVVRLRKHGVATLLSDETKNTFLSSVYVTVN
jgi:hypothetical protein